MSPPIRDAGKSIRCKNGTLALRYVPTISRMPIQMTAMIKGKNVASIAPLSKLCGLPLEPGGRCAEGSSPLKIR